MAALTVRTTGTRSAIAASCELFKANSECTMHEKKLYAKKHWMEQADVMVANSVISVIPKKLNKRHTEFA